MKENIVRKPAYLRILHNVLKVIYLSFIVSAKKHKHKAEKDDNVDTVENTQEEVELEVVTEIIKVKKPKTSPRPPPKFVDTIMDIKGSIRSFFAVEAALQDHARNMICSPLTALMPLGKLVLGAVEESEIELLEAVGLENREETASTFEPMVSNLEYLSGVRLDVASRLFLSSDRSMNKLFLRETRGIFKSTCQKIVGKEARKSAQVINEWVAKKTNKRIKNVITAADIDPETSLVVVNAIYFSGNWKNKFVRLFSENFNTPTGRRRVPMMTRNGPYHYVQCDTLNAQIVKIPYEGENAAMVVILPFSNYGLPVLLRALKVAPELLNEAMEKMTMSNVILSLPKFKIETTLNLNAMYKKMGIETIFEIKTSKLTGIVKDDKVFVSRSVHKSIIEVHERGSETAETTGLKNSTNLVEEVEIFEANRPFYFFIKLEHEQLLSGIYNGYYA